MKRLFQIRSVYLAVPLLLLFYFLAVDSMAGDSPTMDEQNHLARGVAYLGSGDPRFSLEHPPLMNVLGALPLLSIPNLQIPFDDSSWEHPEGWYAFANQLLWLRNADVTRMIFLARLPSIFIAIGLAVISFRFSREMWGKVAAFVTFVLILFDPNFLAHGRYITTDIGGTTLLLLAAYLLWRLWNQPGWRWDRLLVAGVGIGLALSSKLSILLFLPIFALMALLPIYGEAKNWQNGFRRLAQFVIACLAAFVVVWVIYGFQWQPFQFRSTVLEPLNQFNGPLPTFFAGIEQILLVSGGGRPSFLLGQFSTDGWWYYFPVAFLVKTPLLVIVLIIVASVLLLRERKTRARALYLLVPPSIFFLISMLSSLNIGYRHLLPMLPFLYILIGGLAALPFVGFGVKSYKSVLVTGILTATILSIFLIDILLHPHYLSYFNVLGGGPNNGHQVLIDSNIDWGQDLRRLKIWMDENEIDSVKLSWFGTADPAYYGINYEPLPGLTHHFDLWWDVPFDPEEPEPGVYAISVSNLWELPLEDKVVFPWFRDRTPDDRIGYSIHIYVVDDSS